MARTSSRAFLILAAAVVGAACNAPKGQAVPAATTASAAGAPSCEQRQSAATQIMVAAWEKARSCEKDGDCVEVRFQTRCFDACTRAVAVSGKALIEAAVREANEKECAPFVAAGCKLPTPPPCAPRPPPGCRAGRCE